MGFVSVSEISPLGIFTEHNHIVEDADNVQSILHMRVIKRHGMFSEQNHLIMNVIFICSVPSNVATGSTLDYKSMSVAVQPGPSHPIPSGPAHL